jgi:uncharacterized protein (TIGR00297 family)
VACAAAIYAAFYLAGLAVLGAALVGTIAASRTAAARHAADVLPDDDRRGAANILANCGVATLAAVVELANAGWRAELAAVWCVAAITAGASDTVASEIGKAFGGQPRAFPTWQAVRPGTPGAVSVVGTVAGLTAAALIAAPAAALWLISWNGVLVIVFAATLGAFSESVLATALERRGYIGNHALNLVNTLVAATTAVFTMSYA